MSTFEVFVRKTDASGPILCDGKLGELSLIDYESGNLPSHKPDMSRPGPRKLKNTL